MTESAEPALTGRDIIGKTFSTRTRRGYDPIEVDAFLEEVAGHVDQLQADRDQAIEAATTAAKAAEPTLPPPPPVAAEPEPAPEPEAGTDPEAAELVLRMAQKAAGEAIEEARKRADEIVAEAEFQAAEIQREADRKAFETSTRTQGELRGVEAQIEQRTGELAEVHATISSQRNRLRQIAVDVGLLADGIEVLEETPPATDTVDLRDDDATTSPLEADAADQSG